MLLVAMLWANCRWIGGGIISASFCAPCSGLTCFSLLGAVVRARRRGKPAAFHVWTSAYYSVTCVELRAHLKSCLSLIAGNITRSCPAFGLPPVYFLDHEVSMNWSWEQRQLPMAMTRSKCQHNRFALQFTGHPTLLGRVRYVPDREIESESGPEGDIAAHARTRLGNHSTGDQWNYLILSTPPRSVPADMRSQNRSWVR